jgi:hypothetical protein
MPEILVNVSRESGVQDSSSSLLIPDSGDLPIIPFVWDCQEPFPTFFRSSIFRPGNYDPNAREFSAFTVDYQELPSDLESEHFKRVIIIWVRERSEWVAFLEDRITGPKDQYGFSHDSCRLEGPWSLDETHRQALRKAFTPLNIDIFQTKEREVGFYHLELIAHLQKVQSRHQ